MMMMMMMMMSTCHSRHTYVCFLSQQGFRSSSVYLGIVYYDVLEPYTLKLGYNELPFSYWWWWCVIKNPIQLLCVSTRTNETYSGVYIYIYIYIYKRMHYCLAGVLTALVAFNFQYLFPCYTILFNSQLFWVTESRSKARKHVTVEQKRSRPPIPLPRGVRSSIS